MTVVRVEFFGGPRDGAALTLEDPCRCCHTSLSGHTYSVAEGVYLVVVADDRRRGGRADFISREKLAEFGTSLGAPGDPDLGSEASTPGAPNDEGQVC